MVATRTPTASRLNPPSAVPPPAPRSQVERQAGYTDAVFAAVIALQRLLSDSDPAVVLAAAGQILDLEKTRLRHDRPLTGSSPAELAAEALPEEPRPEPAEESDEDRERIEFLQRWLQEKADQEEGGRRVSRTEAEQLYRDCRPHLAEMGLHPPSG